MDDPNFFNYYFETDVWLWPIMTIISLGAFWLYHRQAVHEIKLQRRELVENEHWLNEAQQIGNIGSWYRYLHGDKTRWSPQLRRIYGLTGDPNPSYSLFLDVVHPDDRDAVSRSFDQIHKTGETTVLNYRILRRDGSVGYIENCVKGSFNSEGELVAVYGSVLDVTQRQLYEERLRKALGEAESANRAKGAFLSSVSHEIRTPLNAIIGFSSMMAEKELTPAQYRSYGESVNIAGKTLSALVNDILDLSALESLGFTLTPGPVRVNQIMDEVAAVFQLIVAGKGIELVVKRPDEMPVVHIDGKRLRQILINIIGNAVKFTSQGRVEVDCELVRSPLGRERCNLIFRITDTGVGINPVDQQRIFREFEQESGETNRRFGGSGLGLAIVTQLLELMGGTVQLQSEVGVGSAFTVTFFNVPVQDAPCAGHSGSGASDDIPPASAASSFDAAALSAGEAAQYRSAAELIDLNAAALHQLTDVFGKRFAQLSKGVNIGSVRSLAADLQAWAELRDDPDLIRFAAVFADAAASMKIVELLRISVFLAERQRVQ